MARGCSLTRSDPVGQTFYAPLATAENISSAVFYIAAALSIAILVVDRASQPQLSDLMQGTFALAVIGLFVSGIVVKTHFSARAHSKRVADFVSNTFVVPLIPATSQGYYNTTGEDQFVRMGSSVLENALFTKSIVGRMLRFERIRIIVYVLVWLCAVLYRATDLEVVAVAAQVLFSEQLLSRWVRMEWLRSRVEHIHDDLYDLFQASSNHISKEFRARVVEAVILYETSKAQAAVSLSSRLFHSMNADLSQQWEATCVQLGVIPPSSSRL